MKRKERLLFKKTVARRLKKRVLEKKRLKNNARSKSSKHWLKRLDIYINLDRELLNSLKVVGKWEDCKIIKCKRFVGFVIMQKSV